MKLSSLYSARTFFSSGIEFVRMEWFSGVIKRSNWSISWSGRNKNGIKAGSDINFRNIKLFDRDWFIKKSLLRYSLIHKTNDSFGYLGWFVTISLYQNDKTIIWFWKIIWKGWNIFCYSGRKFLLKWIGHRIFHFCVSQFINFFK